MSSKNKEIVQKSKEVLKEFGYEVKLSHVYEMFSRLSNEKDWNTAKAKGTDFSSLIEAKDKEKKTVKLSFLLDQTYQILELKPEDMIPNRKKIQEVLSFISAKEKTVNPYILQAKIKQFYSCEFGQRFDNFPEFSKYKNILELNAGNSLPGAKKSEHIWSFLQLVVKKSSPKSENLIIDEDEVGKIIEEAYSNCVDSFPCLSDVASIIEGIDNGPRLSLQSDGTYIDNVLKDKVYAKLKKWTKSGIYGIFDQESSFDINEYKGAEIIDDVGEFLNPKLKKAWKIVLA